ncbi:MAG TPA: NUDIX domain-containing protein [Tepidisphaeraceae bacterium]|nr:NUDIX domain-containing protein [Tepidisphaeraceae bacterium]
MLTFHALGSWPEGAVRTTWTGGGRAIVPRVEQAIDRAWAEARSRLGDKLFDGPMCRLERWFASREQLNLILSRTSYRPFLGTNLHNAALADAHGAEVLANPVGVSTALETSDGWVLLGRRNDSVAYYPNRVHPFAGALEPADDLNVFDEVRRELREELSLTAQDLDEIACTGLVEDASLRQPELIFRARTPRTRQQVERALDPAEHHAVHPVRAAEADVAAAVRDPILTPVAVAALLLWGRQRFGNAWQHFPLS